MVSMDHQDNGSPKGSKRDRSVWQAVDDLFQQALDVAPQERSAFLEQAAGGDLALCRAVQELLDADASSRDFLEQAVEVACDLPWGQVLEQSGVNAGAALRDGDPDRQGERIGPYRLLRRLARGGMATVYLAERVDGQWRQQVALKLLRRGLDSEDIVGRFVAERQILSSLHHPNIAQLLDGGTTADGLPFLAMEHVEGARITDYCDEHRLSIEARLDLFREVCLAVQDAHRNLVVHRDLKPSNILVDHDGHAKLLDFGIAKLLDASADGQVTRTGLQMMTPQYASPEQVRGDPITTASDVYQLGILLCELLSGRRPYEVRALSPAQVEAQILEATPTRPSRLVTDAHAPHLGLSGERLRRRLSGDLDVIVLKATRREPGRRYPSADALAHDVERYLKGRTILARPDSWGYRTGKWFRRNKTAAVLGVMALALLVGWGVTTSLQSSILARERDRVQEEARRTAGVRDFLVGLFEASDPYLSRSHPDSITARELLDAGARRLDQLSDDPVMQAELAYTIGRTYRNMGLNDNARTYLQQANDLHRNLKGPTSPELAYDLFELGLAQDKPDSAVPLLRSALAMAEASLGTSDVLTGRILSQLGHRYSLVATADSATYHAYHRRALDILASNPEATRIQYADALRVSAHGRGEVETFEEALAIQSEVYGHDHPAVASALSDLALAIEPTDPIRSDSLLTEALAINEAILGPEHYTTQVVLNNLAGVKRDRGDFENAVPLYRRALRLRREHQPQLRVGQAYTTYGLGVSLMGLGQHAEAEANLRSTSAVLTEELGATHPLVFMTGAALARCLREQDRLADAETLILELQAQFPDSGLAPQVKALVLEQLVAVYAAQGRTADLARVEDLLADLQLNDG